MTRLLSLLLLFLCRQDPAPDAETFLKSVEAKALSAKTLRYTAKLRIESKEQNADLEGAGWLAAGNKFRFTIERTSSGRATEATVVSDGTKMCVNAGPGGPKIVESPAEFAAGLRTVFFRGGALLPPMLAARTARQENLRESILFRDVKFGRDDAVAVRVVTCSLTIKDDKESPTLTLWIDAESLALRKREVRGATGETLTETFTEWKLDEEFKDDLFNLPKEK